MKQFFSLANTVFALAVIVFIIGFSAFSQKEKGSRYSFRKEQFSKDDTTASRKRNRNGADWKFDQLDEQMRQLDILMKNLDIQMKNFDFGKYQNAIDEAIKKVDVEKIATQVQESLKDIDWENMNKQMAETMKVSKLKMVDAEKQMENAKANLQKQKAYMKLNAGKMNTDIENALKNARKSIEGAKEELRNMKEFTKALEKDGLIDKSKPYKIEVKNDELYIDNKKQPKEISDKYRQYYKKSDFTIDMDEGDNVRI